MIFASQIIASLLGAAAQAPAAPAASASPIPNFFLIVMVIMVFWFIVISPQRKEQKERDEMRTGLKKGDAIVTTGGMHGEIVGIDKETVTVRISPKVEVEFDRSAVSRKIIPAGDGAGK